MVEQPAIQREDRGPIPPPSLQISLQDLWVVEDPDFEESSRFVETHHYSHSVKGMTAAFCFLVQHKTTKQTLGAAIFGIPGQKQTLRKYNDSGRLNMLELRRLVLLDEAPRNSESTVLGIMFRLLREKGVQRILSYSDPNEIRSDHPDGKHTGLIYRATGFHKVKEVKKAKAVWWNGVRYPIRNLDQYNNYHAEPKNWHLFPPEKQLIRNEKCPVTKKNPSGRRDVWIIKDPSERIGIAKKLHQALKDGCAELRTEVGKIAYVKDLYSELPYFDTPRHTPEPPMTKPEAKQRIQTAWAAYQTAEKRGLEFGKICSVVGELNPDVLGGIPKETADYWAERYKSCSVDFAGAKTKYNGGADEPPPTPSLDIILTPANLDDTRCLSMVQERLSFVEGKIHLLLGARNDPRYDSAKVHAVLLMYRQALQNFSNFITHGLEHLERDGIK